MKNLIQRSLFGLGIAILIAGCGTDISDSLDDDADAGTADFTTFVALGDSLTAGYADGALYRHGQENSYPAILAQQFALAGGGAFMQPLMPVGGTGSLTLGFVPLPIADRLVVVSSGNPDPPVKPATITPTQSTEIGVPLAGVFNNMGVPGAKSYHLVAPSYGDPAGVGGGSANPFFVRFASMAATTMITDAATQAPTFFVLWIGNNDVLSYATSGGVGVQGAGAPPYGSNDITDPAAFPGIYNGILGLLNSPGNKGVLINIPDVTTIPYFTTVPHDAIPLDAATAAALNGSLAAGYNMVLDGAVLAMAITQAEADRRRLSYSEGQNPVLITDETLTDLSGSLPPLLAQLAIARPATADDYIVLPASAKIGVDNGGQYGVAVPLVDGDALTSDGDPMTLTDEISIIENARTQFNAAIKAAADGDPNLVLFDAAAKLAELNTTGINYGSGGISSAFIQGGGFSLDGVHPTARGYAVIANEIMKVIEDAFGANLPPVDPSDYSTVFYQ